MAEFDALGLLVIAGEIELVRDCARRVA